MEKGRKFEIIVGFFVLIVAIFFFNYVYQKSGWDKSKGYVLNAVFENADGLAEGVDVKISGVRVGKVIKTTINPETFMANVEFYISHDIILPKDSTATIKSEGLLGSRYLAVLPGVDDDTLKENDTILNTSGGIDLSSLIGQFMFSKDKKDEDNSSYSESDIFKDKPIQDELAPEMDAQHLSDEKISTIEVKKKGDDTGTEFKLISEQETQQSNNEDKDDSSDENDSE